MKGHNPRFDTDPSQRRSAPLFRAGQADRYLATCREPIAACLPFAIRVSHGCPQKRKLLEVAESATGEFRWIASRPTAHVAITRSSRHR